MNGVAIESTGATARTLDVDGRTLLFFGGCSYLGLAQHPHVVAAAEAALRTFGFSTAAARGTSGSTVLHRELEEELADFAGAPAAALLPDAGLADLAVAEALVAPGTRVLVDPDAHPCITAALERVGARVEPGREADRARAEGIAAAFSDGTFPSNARRTDVAALRAARFELIAIDDAHGFGVLGARGAGAAEELDLARDDQVLVVALSKALGTYGGAVLGSHATIARIRSSTPFATTTAPPPPQVAAARAALALLRSEPERRARLFENGARLHAIVDAHAPAARTAHALDVPARALDFPVRALVLPEPGRAARVHARLRERGLCVPLVTYPGGPARDYLRFAVTAEHTSADLDHLEHELCASLRT